MNSKTASGKVTYHQQVSYCGKPRCKRCREGVGHGPYWYAYQTVEGRTTRTYIGKHLPPEAEAQINGTQQPMAQPLAERERSLISIYTLGQFRLERRDPQDPLDWQTVTDASWQHQRVRALLGCLVSAPGRKLAREQIMDALWPELEVESAGSRLDRAVYSLRQLFDPTRNRSSTTSLVLTEREMIVLADHPQVWIDADAFEELISRAHAQENNGEKEMLLREAAKLYGGEFLREDRRNEWARSRRDSLQRSWIGLLLELADLLSKREDFQGAIDYLDRLLGIDPANEAAVQRLIRLLEQQGRRGEALRTYKKLAAVLQQEFHILPLPETRALYDALRSGGHNGSLSSHTSNFANASANADGASESALVQIGRSHQSPLVGRQQELDRLNRLIVVTEHAAKFRLSAQKRSGALPDVDRNPQAVLLLGDVGIGKTRLAEELGREVKRHNWVVAWSRVYAQEGAIPYRLWTEVLRKVMQQGILQREAMRKRPLAFSPLSALLPEEFQLPSVEFPTSLSPEQEQLRLWEAVRELLVLVSETSPILIVLDDLQWADSSSCELLAYLARRAQGYPLAIVGTCRDNELGADHPLRGLLAGLRRENAIETIALEPLSAEQIASLVNQVAHTTQPLVQRISDRAAGNPFFAEELARTVAESPTGNSGDEAQQLPDTIAAVLTLRLGRLSSACQRLLSKASVLGSSFAFQVISAMEANSPNYDEDTVLELLEEALASGMLTEEGVGTRITYHFWHPLLASHMQEQLSAARRASQHRRAAEVLQKIYAGREEWYAAITDHLVQGGAAPEQVAHAAELAGNYSFGLSSYPEAEKHYRIVIDHLTQSHENWQHYADILENLGECTRIQGKDGEAQIFYERCLAVRTQNYKQDSSIELEQEAQLQAIIWCEIAKTCYDRRDYVQAKKYNEKGVQVLLNTNISRGFAWADLILQQGYNYWSGGDYDLARDMAKDALEFFTLSFDNPHFSSKDDLQTSARRKLNGDPVDLGRVYVLLSNIEAASGRCSVALPYLEKALAIFEQYDYVREIAIACCNLGDLCLRMAEYARGQAALRRCLSIAERMGEMSLVSFALGNLGLLDTRIGNLIDAENEFREAIVCSEKIEDPLTISVFYTALATVLQEQGRLAELNKVLIHSLTIGRGMRVPPTMGLTLVAVGRLRLGQAVFATINGTNIEKIDVNKYKNLKRAKETLLHALKLEGIEAETRVEGRLVLAQVLLQLDDIEGAREQVDLALEEAKQAELVWLTAYGERVAGNVLIASGHDEEAYEWFEKALRIASSIGTRLEEARTRHQYGALLLRQAHSHEQERRGITYLQEARETFADCKAELDLQLVQRDLAQLALK